MATAAKRQQTIPIALSKELNELALREGKSVQAFLRDLITEHERHRLKVELKKLQNYWSKKANGLKTVRSLKGVLKGMSTENVREKPQTNRVRVVRSLAKQTSPFVKGRKVVDADALLDKARALRRKQRRVQVTDRLIESINRK
ncbi:MAG: hypothetical protein IT389_13390 [Nitrospira sp.]|nr:hypothetical protein [Nitrospira sp.]